MSLILGALLACAAGLAGTVLCPDEKAGRSRLPILAAMLVGGLAWHTPARAGEVRPAKFWSAKSWPETPCTARPR